MNNILLIDVDSKIPNLALMKISQYHKQIGDSVSFHCENPDKIYVSKIFQNSLCVSEEHLKRLYGDVEINYGGSGCNLKKTLPEEIESCTCDYSLYMDKFPNWKKAIGFSSRGCIRNCHFCVVPKKEGKFKRLYDTPKECVDYITANWYSQRSIYFIDNNILADKGWFIELTDYLLENKYHFEFNQGLDVRLLDDEIVSQIAKCKSRLELLKFAFDDIKYQDVVEDGISKLVNAGVRDKDIAFYVYMDKDTDQNFQDALTRCNILRSHNVCSFVMFNMNEERTQRVKDLQRWAARRDIYFTLPFEKYKKKLVSASSLDLFL